jgi:hypothetical protein
MAVRPEKPVQDKTAVSAAGVVLLLGLSAPVLAAPDRDVRCEDSEPTLSVSATELSVSPVNSSEELLDEHLLRPRAESAMRSAFADDLEEAEEPEAESVDDDEDVLQETPVIPSAFGREPSPFKRQMYRRDI